MKFKILMAIGLLTANLNLLFAQGTAFTYQGRLSNGTTGVTGLFDFRFAACDAASGGSQVGSTVNATAVGVTNGLFTVTLDFGVNVFTGAPRFLDLAAKANGSAATFVSMTPRQPLTPAPYATYAQTAGSVAGSFSGDLTGTQGATVVQSVAGYSGSYLVSGAAAANAAGSQNYPGTIVKRDGLGNFSAGNMNGSFTGNGAGITNLPTTSLAGTISGSQIAAGAVGAAQLNASAPSSGQVLTYNGSGLAWNTPAVTGGAWSLTGNAGTTPGVNFIGTTDSKLLELRANNVTGLRIDGTSFSDVAVVNGYHAPNGAPNIIGGSAVNFIGINVVGTTIGGGGATNFEGSAMTNSISADFGTIAGGAGNTIKRVGSGYSATGSFIGGGYANTIGINSIGSVIGGGAQNTIYTNSISSVLGGGIFNYVSGNGSFLGGGGTDGQTLASNSVAGDAAVLVGGLGNKILSGGDTSFIGGGSYNTASGFAAAIGGGNGNSNSGNAGTIAGGQNNSAANVYQPTVGGGYGNFAGANYATVGGGINNTSTAPGAAIAGGANNLANGINSFAAGQRAKAIHDGAFVWSDTQNANFSSTANDQFNVRAQGGARFVTGGAGLTVDGSPVLTSASSGLASLTANQTFTGANTFSNSLTVGTTAGKLTLQGESGVALAITATGGPNSGHVRFRNALEIQPSADNSSPGSLDIRNNSGSSTITMNGGSGAVNAGSVTTSGDVTTTGGKLAMNSASGNLTIQGEDGVAVAIVATGGLAPGHIRVRNALEIQPSADHSSAGYLDVRNTNGNATISMDGGSGSISANGNVSVSGNLSANNTPGVNYAQSSNEAIPVTTAGPVMICSEGNAKPAPGFFIITGYVKGDFQGNYVYLDLCDVSGATPVVIAGVSQKASIGTFDFYNANTLNISWVVPITNPNGYQNFGLRVTSSGDDTKIYGHNLTVLFVPRQNN